MMKTFHRRITMGKPFVNIHCSVFLHSKRRNRLFHANTTAAFHKDIYSNPFEIGFYISLFHFWLAAERHNSKLTTQSVVSYSLIALAIVSCIYNAMDRKQSYANSLKRLPLQSSIVRNKDHLSSIHSLLNECVLGTYLYRLLSAYWFLCLGICSKPFCSNWKKFISRWG